MYESNDLQIIVDSYLPKRPYLEQRKFQLHLRCSSSCMNVLNGQLLEFRSKTIKDF